MPKMVFNNKPLLSCYGCSVCQQVCTHQAIRMVPNKKVFLYPIINNWTCVDCGLCAKVCPTQLSNTLSRFKVGLGMVLMQFSHFKYVISYDK